MAETFEKILIIKPSSLGDIVMALPALSALRKSFPNAKISWLIRPEFAPLIKGHPYLDDIVLFDRKFLGKAWYNPQAFGALLSLVRELRKGNYDVVIDLQGLFRTASLAWLSGCKKRFGMGRTREFAHIFYTNDIDQDENSIHVVDYYLKIVQALGASTVKVEFVIPEDGVVEDSVRDLLKNHNIDPNSYAVFVPGSVHRSKCWPVERFADLADKISSKFSLPIIAVGTESEKSVAKELKKIAKVSITDFVGATRLNELIAMLRAAKLVVSNDTGPGHIAAALGRPLVIMYSWSNPARIAPYGRDECMVAKEPYSRGDKIKSNDPKHDIKEITVDEVFQKVCEQMKHSSCST